MATTTDGTDTRRVTEDRLRGTRAAVPLPRVPADAVLPPGPNWPVVAQSMFLFRFRHRAHPWLHKRYGDVFSICLLPGNRPHVLFSRPEHVREIFAGDPADFHGGKGNAILGPVMGAHSLLLQDGVEHQRARKLLMPAFNGHALRAYEALVTAVAKDEVSGWAEGQKLGQTFRSLDRMNALTLEVILRVVFGVTDDERLARLRPCVSEVVRQPPTVLLGWGRPWLMRFGPWRRLVQNQYLLDELVLTEIAERRAVTDLADRTDVLSRLILAGEGESDALDDTELRDQLVTLLLAGHETTAAALAWSLYELGRDPALLRRAQRAADTDGDDLLEAILKEAMRLHPIIPMVVRTLMRPATIGGIDLPAGVTVGPSIVVAHQRADAYPNPEVFRPDRFLGGNPPTNTWIPFGGGVRRCIGAGFSLMEGAAVLREILSSYDVVAVGRDEPMVRNITSVPRRGARIRVTLR